MRVLHLLGERKLPRQPDGASASGVVRAALEIARQQVGLGHVVHVVAVGDEAWCAEWEGVRLLVLRRAPWAQVRIGGRLFDFRQHLPYVMLTRRHSFDVAHGHMYSNMRFLRARRRIVHFHSDPFPGGGNGRHDLRLADLTSIKRHSDAQVAVSQFVAGELQRVPGGLAGVHVVYNGVEASRFDPARWQAAGLSLRQTWHVPEGAAVFLFAGAIVPEKGVLPLARAFVQLAAHVPGVHLVLAGSSALWAATPEQRVSRGAYEDDVARALHALREAGQVIPLGGVSASTLPAVYAACDAVVMPSTCREGFSLVAIEALASGRPVIASDCGGLQEAVNGQCGMRVPPGDEPALQAAMHSLATDPGLRARLGQGALQEARRFSWQSAARHLDLVYQSIAHTD